MRLGPMLIPVPGPGRSGREEKNRDQSGRGDSRIGFAETRPPYAALREPCRWTPGESAKHGEPNFRHDSAQHKERANYQIRELRKEGGRFHGVNSPVES